MSKSSDVVLLEDNSHDESAPGANADIRETFDYADNILATLREPFIVLSKDLRVKTANLSFYQTFHVLPEETQNQFIYDLGNRQWDIPALRTLLEEVLSTHHSVHDYEVEHDFQTIGQKLMLLNARRIRQPGNHSELILLAFEDITERKRKEQNLAFLADVSKDFAPLSSVVEIMELAGERTAEYLKLSHCLFAEINEAADEAIVLYDRHAPDAPDLVGVYRLAEFHTKAEHEQLSAGKQLVINDVRHEPRSASAAEFESLGIRALVTAPYLSRGKWEFALSAQHNHPYQWREDECELLSVLASQIYIRIERARVEAALHESEDRMNAILQNMNSFIYLLDAENRFVHVNRLWEEIFNLTTDEVRGKSIYDVFSAAIADEFAANNRRVIDTGKIIEFEEIAPLADGEHLYHSVKVPRLDADGKAYGIVGISTDITERKRKEQNLAFLAGISMDFAPLSSVAEIMELAGERIAAYFKVSHCVFTEIDEAAGEAIVIYDRQSPGAVKLVGAYQLEQFHTEEERQQLTAGRPIIINDVRHLPRSKEAAAEFELLGIRSLISAPYVSGGRWKFALSAQHSKPSQWRTDESELLSVLAAQIYVRIERARVEAALRESEERFSSLFDSIDEGFCIIEMIFDENEEPIDYRFEQTNPAMERLTGLKDALGKTARELVPDLEDFWFETYGKVALTGEAVRFENKSEPMNRWFDVHASRVGGSSSHRVALVFNNITERKEMEVRREQLLQKEHQAREAAEAATRAKDEFLAVVSHELRNPLNSILGYARLLRKMPPEAIDAAQIKKTVDIIERSGQAQLELINDLLDTARIISGKLKLEIVPVNLSLLINDAVEVMRPAADAKKIALLQKSDPGVGHITGDPQRLQQVILNLINNAVKFTQPGGLIYVTLRRAGADIIIQVRDNGKGISPDFLLHIFGRFTQADASEARRHGGLGLGLSLVKQLVELHGGEITVESEGEGKGTTFTIKLPAQSAYNSVEEARQKLTLSEADRRMFAGLSVLVIDDEPEARELMTTLLSDYGAEVTAVASAVEGFTLLTDEANGKQFSVLISDIGMPEEDGYSLMRRYREWERDRRQRLPAIALTAFGRTEDRMAAIMAGFQMHAPKPVETEELIAVINSLLGRFN